MLSLVTLWMLGQPPDTVQTGRRRASVEQPSAEAEAEAEKLSWAAILRLVFPVEILFPPRDLAARIPALATPTRTLGVGLCVWQMRSFGLAIWMVPSAEEGSRLLDMAALCRLLRCAQVPHHCGRD